MNELIDTEKVYVAELQEILEVGKATLMFLVFVFCVIYHNIA